MAEIDASIADINANISTLQGSVLGELSALYNSANVLANHVNSITESQYIIPYTPEEKPISTSDYYARQYYFTENILNALEDGVELYIADNDDPIQDSFKQPWEVASFRQEIIRFQDSFNGSKYIFEEIQTAKDLTTDILNSSFINTDDKIESTRILSEYITEIKKHIVFLKARARFLHKDYKENFEKIKLVADRIRLSILIPIVDAVQDLDSGDQFRIQAFKLKYNFDNAKNDSQKVSEAISDYIVFAVNVLNRPVYGEHSQAEFTRKYTGKSKVVWDALPQSVRDYEIETHMDLLRDSLIVPVSYLDYALLPMFYGKTVYAGAKGVYAGTKALIANPKVLINLANPLRKPLVNKLIKEVPYLLPKMVEKYAAKNFSSKLKNLPCFKKMGVLSFHTEAIKTPNECFTEIANYVFAEVRQRVTLAGAGGKYTADYVLEKLISKSAATQLSKKAKTLTLAEFTKLLENKKILVKLVDTWPDWKKALHGEMSKVYQEFFKNGGITIREIPVKDMKILAPDFESLAKNVTVEIQGMNGLQKWGAVETTDFGKATQALISKLNITGATKNEIETFFRETLNVTWHHHEGLKKMILIPSKLHSGGTSPHWGATSIIKKINEFDISVRSQARTIWEDTFKSLYP